MGPDQLIDSTSASDDLMWLPPFDADVEDDFNALINSIATPKAAICSAGQEPAAWQAFCLPSPRVSPQHTQQVQQHADNMAQVVPDPQGSFLGQSALTQSPQATGAAAAGVSTGSLGSEPPAALMGPQWDYQHPNPSAAAAHQQGSMGFLAPSALGEPAACVPPMPAMPSYHNEPYNGRVSYSAPQAVPTPAGFAAADAGPGMHPTMQYPAPMLYAGPTAVPAGILSSMSSLESAQSSYSNFPAAYMGASQLPYRPQVALLPAQTGGWQLVPPGYAQQLNSPLLCCAGMGPAPYSMPAGWSMLPSSCLQASAHGMHDICCPFGADCAGMCGTGSSSSNSTSGHNAGTAAQHADGASGSTGSYGVSDAAAAAASVLAAAGAASAAARSAGHCSAHAGSPLSAAHPAAATGMWPTAHAPMASAGNISYEADNTMQQQQLAVSAQAAGAPLHKPATLEPFPGAGVPSAAPLAAAGELQGSRTRSSPMRSKASAQVQPPAARLGTPANKVIAKVLHSRLAGRIQDKLQALANPVDERKKTAATNHTALQATLKSLEVSKAQVDARINAMRAEVDKMNANNALLRAVNADLRAQVQAVMRQAQCMGLPVPESVWAPVA